MYAITAAERVNRDSIIIGISNEFSRDWLLDAQFTTNTIIMIYAKAAREL